MNRKPISKGLRFRIFERDSFTCQYCGRKPPEVVLELDHIHPCCEGGDNSEANLIASCADCNRGKSGRVLHRTVTPDADMEYLRSEQIRVEHERYVMSKEARECATYRVVEALQRHWCNLTGMEYHPADNIVLSWLARFSPEIVERGLSAAAVAYQRRSLEVSYGPEPRIVACANRYASGVMYRLEAEDAQSA